MIAKLEWTQNQKGHKGMHTKTRTKHRTPKNNGRFIQQ